MGNCLVTKLKGSVSNNELLRIGEMRIRIAKVENPTDATQGFRLDVNKPVVLEIVGDGYFTDKTLTENKGKTITLNADVNGLWVSNEDVEIAILDKYSITTISINYPYQTSAEYGRNMYLNLSDLKYSTALTFLDLNGAQVTGDIANLKNLTALTNLKLSNTQVTGDIANLKSLTALMSLRITGIPITGDIANLKNLTALTVLALYNTQVSGDIANLKSLTVLRELNLINTQVTGDIANLKNLTALTSISLSNKQVSLTGDIGKLSNLSNCKYMKIGNSKLTGDIAILPSECRFVSFANDKGSVFTWSTRPSSAKIIAIEGNANLTNIDKMLQDQAQCQVGFLPGDSLSFKTISVAGNRTSASDNAVATLQQKGYTISITKA